MHCVMVMGSKHASKGIHASGRGAYIQYHYYLEKFLTFKWIYIRIEWIRKERASIIFFFKCILNIKSIY